MVHCWRRDQGVLFNGELKMSARRKIMGHYTPKYPELNQQLFEWLPEQRCQGENSFVMSVFFWMKPKWNEFVMQLFDCERCLHSVTFQLTCGNQHFWLVGILLSQNNAVKTKFTFSSLNLYFPQWINCYCLCRFTYCHERINVASERNLSKWSRIQGLPQMVAKLEAAPFIRSAYMWINANFLTLEKVMFSKNSRL